MNVYSQHKNIIFLFTISLLVAGFVVFKILHIFEPIDNSQHSLATNFYSYQNINLQKKQNKPVLSPVITSITANPDTLQPADERMVNISLNVNAAPMSGWKIVSVVKNEPKYGIDEDYNGPDAIFSGQSLKLRAERSNKDDARIYTVYIKAFNRDQKGSEASCLDSIVVKVP